MYRPGVSRLDSVNIRIGIADDQTEQAVEAFGLQSIGPSQSTVHLFDYRAGTAVPSLAVGGVIIAAYDSADVSLLTVQVRHVRRLHPRWAAFYGQDSETLRIEEERDSTRRVLAASFTVRGGHHPQESADPHLRLTDLLTPSQWSFMQDCAPGQPRSGPLVRLGPILSLDWTVRLDRIDATVSRWRHFGTADGREPVLDAIEVSRRSLPEEAGFLYPALATPIRRQGLDPDGGIPWLEMRAASRLQARDYEP